MLDSLSNLCQQCDQGLWNRRFLTIRAAQKSFHSSFFTLFLLSIFSPLSRNQTITSESILMWKGSSVESCLFLICCFMLLQTTTHCQPPRPTLREVGSSRLRITPVRLRKVCLHRHRFHGRMRISWGPTIHHQWRNARSKPCLEPTLFRTHLNSWNTHTYIIEWCFFPPTKSDLKAKATACVSMFAASLQEMSASLLRHGTWMANEPSKFKKVISVQCTSHPDKDR